MGLYFRDILVLFLFAPTPSLGDLCFDSCPGDIQTGKARMNDTPASGLLLSVLLKLSDELLPACCLTEAESFVFSTKLPHFINKQGSKDGNSTGTGGAVFSKDE